MIFFIVVLLLILLYKRATKNFDYWKKRNVKYRTPVPFFGNSLKKYCQMISPTDQFTELYKMYPDEKYVGCYEANHLSLIIRDPELIKRVLVTDFHQFFPKGVNMFRAEPLMDNLFFADGDLWKLLRQKMLATFTTAKLKKMIPLIEEQCAKMENIIARAASENKEVNIRDLTGRFMIDTIAACGFGIDSNALNDDASVFRKLGDRIFNINARDAFAFASKFMATKTFRNTHFLAPEIEDTIVDIVKDIFKYRENTPVRKDFIDVLLEMKQKGSLVGESLTKRSSNGTPEKIEIIIDDMVVVAQAFIFFAAGYETASAATSFTLHQLAYNPEIQKKCQIEIDNVLKTHGKLTYEAIHEMKYLEMAFKEAMRLFPPIGFLIRQCAKKYTFPETDMTIDAGVVVLIPLQGLQNDEKYFEDPDVFKPERFHPDNLGYMEKHVYLPFGEGPRVCIGQRLGMIQSIACLAAILNKFSVVPSVNTKRHLKTDPTIALVQNIKGGIPMNFVART